MCRKNGVVIILTLYVDDVLLVGADIQVIESIEQKLMKRFKMTKLFARAWDAGYA